MRHLGYPAHVAPGSSSSRQTDSGRGTTFRPDIEGLRAIAVVAVMLYHAGLAFLPGGFAGVDIFFVISGFLITSLMIREVTATGRLRLSAFWARRARRLLPAATLALLFSAMLAVWVLPDSDRSAFGGDIVAAATYVVNWRLGYRSVDYLAQDVGSSPVQHFWSLAVEEQFYIVWPLLIVAVLLLFRVRWRRALAGTIGLLGAGSFLFALYYSVAQPGLSFFVSTTRAWELSAGALVALALPQVVRIPALLRTAVAWGG